MSVRTVAYRIEARFVDDSYWDDGSRWVTTHWDFWQKKDTVTFAQKLLQEGVEVRGQNGPVRVRPESRELKLLKITTTEVEVDWP